MTVPVQELTSSAYVYGFPMVFNLDQVHRYVHEGLGSVAPAPFNQFSHARTLAGPEDTFVSINNDTVYSFAQIDLSVGPVELDVPDAGDRYYVMQFIDAWTNNFAYVGKRATGTRPGRYLLVPPAWQGETPADTTVIRFPTTVGTIAGRWFCAGDDDLPAVHALQDGLSLRALDADAVPAGLAEPSADVPDELLFLEKLRLWSQQFPPAERDLPLQESFAPIGITETGASPYTAPDAATASALAAGLTDGAETLRAFLMSGNDAFVNGWKDTLHFFDYNLDFFEVGTINEDRFKISDPKLRIAMRAAAALAGLWGNHAYEAAYSLAYVDDQNAQLVGTNVYTLHLDPVPPVNAFWSLTMYAEPDYFLVANPIDRYSLGDRTPGIVYNDDGSITITISHERPTDPKAFANWLPAPEGAFRPVMRMYQPEEAILDMRFVVPAITRS